MFVKLWMTKDVITIAAQQKVTDLLQIFKGNKIRRIPVVDDSNNLVGIVSKQDIFNIMPSVIDGSTTGSSRVLIDDTKVEEIMTKHPITVETLTPLESVAQLMRSNKVGGVPVLEDGKLLGIITESDIFAAFTEVLGGKNEGVRIELIISKSSKEIYSVLDIFKRYDIFIQAITVHHDFGENQRLLTAKISGDEYDEMLDTLRSSGVQINRITDEEENG